MPNTKGLVQLYLVNNYVTELRSHIDYPFLRANDTKWDSKIQKSLPLLKNEFKQLACLN